MMTYSRAWEVGSSLNLRELGEDDLNAAYKVLKQRAVELWGGEDAIPVPSGLAVALTAIKCELLRRQLISAKWFMAIWDDPEQIAPRTAVFMSHNEAASFCANLDPSLNPRIRTADRWTPSALPLRWALHHDAKRLRVGG